MKIFGKYGYFWYHNLIKQCDRNIHNLRSAKQFKATRIIMLGNSWNDRTLRFQKDMMHSFNKRINRYIELRDWLIDRREQHMLINIM